MRTALITGGAGGIGSEIARTLARKGYRIIVNYKSSRSAAESLASEIISGGGLCDTVEADVGNADAVKRMYEYTRSFCRVDTLINNAGVSLIKLLQDTDTAEIERVLSVNVKGVIYVTKAYIPDMISAGFGRIINISSMWGVCGASMETVYSASKAAVDGFTRALAKEVGPSGITVNAVAPGLIDTKMNASLTESELRAVIDETPLGRIGSPKDVAAAVSFLADENSYITGEILNVNGGLVI